MANQISEELVDILVSKTGVNDKLFFRILLAYKFAQMATMMRCGIKTALSTQPVPPNVYALNLAESGFSKGKSVNILEDDVFSGFKMEYQVNTYQKIEDVTLSMEANELSMRMGIDIVDALNILKKQLAGTPKFKFSFAKTTIEGLRSLRLRMSMSGTGATCLETDEIGSVLTEQEMVESLALGLEIYDMGKGKSKNTKTESTIDVPNPVPSNILMFGTPTKLLDGDKTERQFIELLETGYARRLLFGYVKSFTVNENLTAEELYEQLTNPASDMSMATYKTYFKELGNETYHNMLLTMTKDVELELLKYRLMCESNAKDFKEHQSIEKAEMNHRYWKALKIAGAYAFINKQSEITIKDLEDAIELVDESGKAFKEILNREQTYVRLAKYIADVGRKITQVELVENLPFYKGSESQKKDLMNLAIAYGYSNGIIIKKTYSDNIEFIEGNRLEPTKLDNLIVSYSKDITENYKQVVGKWDEMHKLTKATGFHYCNHGFKDGYRNSDNALESFNLLMLDVDNGLTVETCTALLKDFRFLISTTKRHTEANNRFRIIFPLTHTLRLNSEDYKQFMKNIFQWLPFECDEQTADIARKWESFNGEHIYNEGKMFDAMMFIPNTKKQIETKERLEQFGSLDALQKWFVINTPSEGGRNNMIHKYGMALLDKGLDVDSILYSIEDLNSKLEKPLPTTELQTTVFRTIIREEAKRNRG